MVHVPTESPCTWSPRDAGSTGPQALGPFSCCFTQRNSGLPVMNKNTFKSNVELNFFD